MDPALPPKPQGRQESLLAKAVAGRKKLLMGLGAVVVIWFALMRPSTRVSPPPTGSEDSSTIARRSSNSIANDISAIDHTTPSQSPEQNERVERYPMLDSPDEVAPDEEFHIQVSLTERQLGPELSSMKGDVTPEGKLAFSLPPTQDNAWKIEVVVMQGDFEFTQGTKPQSFILLPRQGDATSATFYVKVKPRAVARGVAHVVVTFNYNGTYEARISRDIQIKGTSPLLSEAPAMRRTVKESGPIENTPAAMNHAAIAPDLTVIIAKNNIEVMSPYLGTETDTLPDMESLHNWLAQRAPVMTGRGQVMQATGQAAIGQQTQGEEDIKGFGDELYDHYAPPLFRKAFWMLVDQRGQRFRTIQIYSDNPDIPWELMRPMRQNRTDRQTFLGENYSLARWHMTDGLQEKPPMSEIMAKTFVIAPHYIGARTLDAEATETEALAKMDGYSPVNGNLDALRLLFRESPQGIVHFAGHGQLNPTRGDYEILLEDGGLNTTYWKGMAQDHPSNHPFFFFNACDVGQVKLTGNFVDGWGPAVLAKGASGYIGALFPVDDQVAAKFSIRFYKLLQDQMRAGRPADVSATLEQTRREIYGETKDPTALAYVLYGDTNLAFIRR
jgi:CHAT domain